MRIFLQILPLAVAMVTFSDAQTVFTDSIPKDYFLRKDLTDCAARFDKRSSARAGRINCVDIEVGKVPGTEIPHMAVLGWTSPDSATGIRWKCGGSLITERYVLIAAHCVADSNYNLPRFVRLGDVDLATADDDKYAQQYETLRIIRHPSHRFSRKYFDLALIELNGPVRVTEGVCPACLWTKRSLPQTDYEAAGYGATSYAADAILILLKTDLFPTDRETCAATYNGRHGLPKGIAVDQMCAANNGTDTCQGDSGGPLQVALQSFYHVYPFIFGVTSFGSGCAKGFPGVYQLIADHIPWIESVINEKVDPLRCIQKYAEHRQWKPLIPGCSVRDGHVSRVRLLWPKGSPGPVVPCSGTLIDYNTVITSARCARARGRIAPSEVEITVSHLVERAKIVQIQIHPGFQEPSYRNDLALLRLDKYLQPNGRVSASCISSPEPSVICSDRQTLDRVACWDQFVDEVKTKFAKCNDEEEDSIITRLIWGDDSESSCTGLMIRSETIITSIDCLNENGKGPPIAVRLANKWRVDVGRILKHVGFDPSKPRERNTALVLLDFHQYNSIFYMWGLLPKCIRNLGHSNPLTYISAHDPDKPIESGDNIYVPTFKHCSVPMAANLTGLFDETLSNGTRYMCWDVNRQVVPGAVVPEPGAGLLDDTHRFIRGVNTYSSDYGSSEPIVSTNLVDYTDWITQFVLQRTDQDSIVFPSDDDDAEYGTQCVAASGRSGICMPDYGCRREVQRHQVYRTKIKRCGFKNSISYICCPPEHQDIPIVP